MVPTREDQSFSIGVKRNVSKGADPIRNPPHPFLKYHRSIESKGEISKSIDISFRVHGKFLSNFWYDLND